MPSVYIRSKHESLSTLHGAMCVNFLNRFPNALLEDFEKVLKIYISASRTRTLKSDALKFLYVTQHFSLLSYFETTLYPTQHFSLLSYFEKSSD